MTLDEARKVAAVCSTADGGCVVCAGALAAELTKRFPEFIWEYDYEAYEIAVKPAWGANCEQRQAAAV